MRYGHCIDGSYRYGMTNSIRYFGFGSQWLVGAIIIIIIALLFIAYTHNTKKKSVLSSEADETLKLRYVNGEITDEEYQKIKKMIQ